MALIGREQALEAQDQAYEDVPCPEWGGDVRLRSITAQQREHWERRLRGADGKPNIIGARARLIAMCAVDEHGNRLFTEDDIPRLSRKSAKVMERLFDAARKLNGIGDDDLPEAIEDFDEAQSDGSGTD